MNYKWLKIISITNIFLWLISSVNADPQYHNMPLTHDGSEPVTTPVKQQFKVPVIDDFEKEELKTYRISDKAYYIKSVAKAAKIYKQKDRKEELKAKGLVAYENKNETLFFYGKGGAGLKSTERLIVENCTFIMEFPDGEYPDWDARRSAIFVQGFKEVIVRNCRFVSKGKGDDPVRKTNASVTAYDCLKVNIENCYFEGKTNWMRGHILVYCCGPTKISNVEVAGIKEGDKYICGGGIWVANGLGEGKVGYIHKKDPENMIYPAGPALIENCYVHDQQGKLNTDGIYVQSIHNYLIRNCKVENWRQDALLDLGFRDSAAGHCKFEGKKLKNHGAFGVVENSEFSGGFIKDSVGAGGGLIFRKNLFKDIWLMPYIFDGGNWYVINNKFVGLRGPFFSSYDRRVGGWDPIMFQGGSKIYFYGNLFETDKSKKAKALYIVSESKRNKVPLKGNVLADYNVYNTAEKVSSWARDGEKKIVTFAEWKEYSGNDKNSLLDTDLAKLAIPANALQMPGGFTVGSKTEKVGLTGPIGPQGEIGVKNADEKEFLKEAAKTGPGKRTPPEKVVKVKKGHEIPAVAANFISEKNSDQVNKKSYTMMLKGAKGFSRNIYLNFGIPKLKNKPVKKAELVFECVKLGKESGKNVNITVGEIAESWAPDKLNWANAPKPKAKVGEAVIKSKGLIAVDITELLIKKAKSGKVISLALIDEQLANRTVGIPGLGNSQKKPKIIVYY